MASMALARLDSAMLYASLPQTDGLGGSPKEIQKTGKAENLTKSIKGFTNVTEEQLIDLDFHTTNKFRQKCWENM